MRIACLSTSQIPSSTANSIQVMKMCQALVQLGHTVRLWVPGKTQVAWSQLAAHYGLRDRFEINWVASFPVLRRYDFVAKAWLQVMAWSPDLVYTWMPQVGLLALQARLPLVLEIHDRPSGKIGPRLLRWIVRVKGEKRFAVITQALYRVLREEWGMVIPETQVVIAPNGVDLERYRDLPTPSEARRLLGLAERFTAVYSGHFYPGRGMGLLLEMACRLPHIQFLWVGGREEAVTYWRNTVAEHRLQNVILTGFVENRLLPLYQAAGEVLLMPYERAVAGSSGGNSADICSPMKMFEYLACGRAILSSDLPVLHEVLNEKNARFCPPEEINAWEQALDELAAHPEVCRELGEQARADAAHYTWVARAQRILAGWNSDRANPLEVGER
ncbi:glycosyltransferase family 4 protein [uncultured Thermanaerothrix sp.]|uniref:glycosyltransferase family 4 protein n=1 Tax=uncultured Thermanaerothrix sp. TaxID=1195149 RepID=UPI00262C5C68|nr:glycosyltransferase family 4 protein [uncultured Thermanaerothrix sp.]